MTVKARTVVLLFSIGLYCTSVWADAVKDARKFSNRGWQYVNKFDYKLAIQDFNQAIQLNSKSDYAYANRGIAEFLSGDFAAAESDFAMSERLNPEPVRAYSALERILARLREAKQKGGSRMRKPSSSRET